MAGASGGTAAQTPDYGLDSPLHVRRMFGRGAWSLAFALLVWFMNRTEYPGPAITLLLVLGALGLVCISAGWYMVWSSRTGKLALRERLLDALALKDGERVLDAGCGKGLMAIGAAKRMKAGKVTAVDTWNPLAVSGNSSDAVRENAKLEGVADRVRVESGDLPKLMYPDGSFDAVVSSLALHFMADEPDRDQSVRETYRVLKPGGRLLIFDVAHTARYAEILRDCGAADVTVKPEGFLWCLPNRSVAARKA